ncbi:MAG: glucan biosynthesis protein G [Pseudomonadota bacterium]
MTTRRDLLKYATALAASGGLNASLGSLAFAQATQAKVQLGQAKPFDRESLVTLAKGLAAKPYEAPQRVPQEWLDLTYDQYRAIRFDRKAALWAGSDRPFEVDFFPPGLYFPTPIAVSIVEDGQQRPVLFDLDVFIKEKIVPKLPLDDPAINYSGFRLQGHINDPDRKDEVFVFQGASYFRSLGKGDVYGLSARGLALKTGDAEGEEFPEFRQFWLEGGLPGDSSVTVHALLDSPSVAGLYRFVITPGESTIMDVEARLFPREELAHVGIAAGTSMFLFDETNRTRFDDFRPAVHDSDGLLIENGAGETLWRALANPVKLQVSSFVDDNPRGFGLMQRPRQFDDYVDLEALYHRRPGLWVVPGEDWGKGAVTLVEIPADREIYDNIVSYWRPRVPLKAGGDYTYTYRLYWGAQPPLVSNLARVINTRMGKRWSGRKIVTVDFSDTPQLPEKLDSVTLHVSSNRGDTSDGILQRNPSTGGVRLAFDFDPGEAQSVELRAQLVVGGKPVSEVWLYRWTL